MKFTLANNNDTKTTVIPGMKLKQLQYEIDTWKRLLDFINEENILFKIRISDLLKDSFDRILLEEVDGFQNRFIRQDEITCQLRNDIAELNKLPEGQIIRNGKIFKAVDNKMRYLRRNMKMAENRFIAIRKDFNHFLLQIL